MPGLRFKVAFKQKACSPRNINGLVKKHRLILLISEILQEYLFYFSDFRTLNLRVLQTLVISISLKTEISDIIPGICWCHSLSFSVTNPIAPGNTGCYLTHLFELFVQHLVILHLLPSFWMLLSPGIATSITTALFCSELPPLYPVGQPAAVCQSGCCSPRGSQRRFSQHLQEVCLMTTSDPWAVQMFVNTSQLFQSQKYICICKCCKYINIKNISFLP